MDQVQRPYLGIAIDHEDQLHPSILDKLSPEYIESYNKTYVGKPAVNNLPPAIFQNTPLGQPKFPASLDPVAVGESRELVIPRIYTNGALPPIEVLVYIPTASKPASGYPFFYSIHGGGWALGDRYVESPLNTRICEAAAAVVISPEYRKSPLHTFPAAIEDCWEVLLWIYNEGAGTLGLDMSKCAIGGASAGGHLAATMCNMLIDMPNAPNITFRLNALACPVTDVTAADPTLGSPTWNNYKSWSENRYAPTLSYNKMMWYRNMFVPSPYLRLDWHASPMLVPDHFWAKLPPAWVGVVDVDVLRDEGIAYAKRLEAAGAKVELKVYKGAAHPAIAQAQLKEGGEFAREFIEAIRNALHA